MLALPMVMKRDRRKEMSKKKKRLEEQSLGQKPGTRLANPAQEQPWKMLAVELKMEQPAAQALVYVSFVAILHTGEREGEQGQSCKESPKTFHPIDTCGLANLK